MSDNSIDPATIANQTNPPMPSSIVKAVCAIKSTLEAVKKSRRNQHGGYDYASIDDIQAALTNKMGEVGLIVLGMEDSVETISKTNKEGKDATWIKVVILYVLATETDTWIHPKAKRTVMLQFTGPQSFQAAHSFAEKSFLKSLFDIPTGDMELDALPEDFTYRGVFDRTDAPPPPPPPLGGMTGTQYEQTLIDAKRNDELLADLDTELATIDSIDSLRDACARCKKMPAYQSVPHELDELFLEHAKRIKGDGQ